VKAAASSRSTGAETRLTKAVVNRPDGYTIMLPGTWAAIPMTTPEAVRKRVTNVIKQQMPAGDRLARMRRDARDELLNGATDALSRGATMFAIALELLPGLPFGASILSFNLGWPPPVTPGDDGVEGRLSRAFPGSTLVEHHDGVLARRGGMETEHAFDTTLRALNLQYWLVRGDLDPVVFMVSVPACPDEELMTLFFDSVIDSVHWSATAA
jgi:hypothetical protein